MTAESNRVPKRRSYGDSCGIARALDLVGERWALLVTRELLLGPKRFTDLRAGLPNVGPDVLAQRLRELERSGVVARRQLPPPAAARVYELTSWGQELEPVLLALGRWGSRAPLAAESPPLGVDAIVVALQTTFDRGALDGGGWDRGAAAATFELWLGEQAFTLELGHDGLRLRPGRAPAPVAVISTDPGILAGVLWHGHPLHQAVGEGALRVDGDVGAVERLLTLFPAPVPAAA